VVYKKESWIRKITAVTFFAIVCLVLELVILALILAATGETDIYYAVGDSNTLFQWHPILGGIGFCLALSQSLILYPALIWVPKGVVRVLHGIAGLTWLCLAIACLAIAVKSKIDMGDTHFMEVHERLGLVVVVLSCMQALVGLIKAFTQFTFSRHFLHWHGKMGTIIYTIAIVVIATGVELLFEDTDVQTTYSITIYSLLVLLGFFVLLFEPIAKGGNLIPKLPAEDPNDYEEFDEAEESRRYDGIPVVSFRSSRRATSKELEGTGNF